MLKLTHKRANGDSARRTPLRTLEVVLWSLLGLASAGWQVTRAGGPQLYNDSYQYLSVTANLAAGRGLFTSILHFDVERAHGRIPAPITTFPAGYPAVIALLRVAGVPLETGAVAVAALSVAAVVPLLAWAAGWMGVTTWALRLALLLWTGNSLAASYAASVLTEPLFTVVSLGALLLLIRGDRTHRPGSVVAGFALAGLSYWIRYAGLFLCVTLALAGLWRLFRGGRRAPWLGGLLLMGTIVGCGLLRNVVLTGTWQGGNTKKVFRPVAETLWTLVTSFYHLFFGPRERVRLGVPEGMVVLGATLALALWLQCRGFGGLPGLRSRLAELGLPLAYCVVYSAGMLYLGASTVITFGERMLFAVLPVLLLAVAALADGAAQAVSAAGHGRLRVYLAALALAAAGYVGVNARSHLAPVRPGPHQLLAERLALPTAAREPLRSWIERQVPRDAVVAATDGQASGYVLQRPTVSLADQWFSEVAWTEESVREVMRRFRAGYLMVHPGAPAAMAPEQQDFPFLAGLAAGRAPSWLQLAARNRAVIIYSCPECARGL